MNRKGVKIIAARRRRREREQGQAMPEATSSTLTSTSMPTTIQRCQAHLHGMRDEFGVKLWDVQGRPVGPHPDWSCRLAFGPQKLSDAVGWLALKACLVGLVVLVDPQTGDAVKDLVGGDRASGSVIPTVGTPDSCCRCGISSASGS